MINWRKMIIGYLLSVAGFVAAEYTVLRALPLSTWFEYRMIAAEAPVPLGGPIKMQSSIVQHLVTDMRYNDVLFCDFTGKGEYSFYSSSTDSYDAAPPMDGVSKWTYAGGVPITHAWCFMRSAVTAQLRYGIRKTPQEIRSEPFEIGATR